MLHFIASTNSFGGFFFERTKVYLNFNATYLLLGMLQLRLDSMWLQMMIFLHLMFSCRLWQDPEVPEWGIPGQGM